MIRSGILLLSMAFGVGYAVAQSDENQADIRKAIQFQKAEQAAVERQMRMDEGLAAPNSADRAITVQPHSTPMRPQKPAAMRKTTPKQ